MWWRKECHCCSPNSTKELPHLQRWYPQHWLLLPEQLHHHICDDHSFINSCLVGSYQRPGHFYYLDCNPELCSFQLHHAKFRSIKLCSHQRAIVIFSCIKLRSIKPIVV